MGDDSGASKGGGSVELIYQYFVPSSNPHLNLVSAMRQPAMNFPRPNKVALKIRRCSAICAWTGPTERFPKVYANSQSNAFALTSHESLSVSGVSKSKAACWCFWFANVCYAGCVSGSFRFMPPHLSQWCFCVLHPRTNELQFSFRFH